MPRSSEDTAGSSAGVSAVKRFLTVPSLALLVSIPIGCAETPVVATKKTTVSNGSGNVRVEPSPGTPTPSTPSAFPQPGPAPIPNGPTPVNPQNTVVLQPSPPIVASGKPLDLVAGIDTTSYYVKVGQISGWAGDKNNTPAYLEVRFYLDGDSKRGKSVGSTKANLVGSDGSVDGDHAFIFDIPVASRDGKPHKVYAYVNHEGVDTILNSSFPYTLTFFGPKRGAAETVYNKIGFNSGCKGCHSFDYVDRWDVLLREGSAGVWKADDNYLYNKVVNNHRSISSGKPCNVINCSELKNWWTAEFGP